MKLNFWKDKPAEKVFGTSGTADRAILLSDSTLVRSAAFSRIIFCFEEK